MLTTISYVAILLATVTFGLGGVICWSAYQTLRPARGVHLMFWHVLAITVGVLGFHVLFLVRVVSDLDLFDSISVLPGTIPRWYLITGTLLLALNAAAFWIILKVQRGRHRLQRMTA